MKINFKNIMTSKLQEYIGEKVYIVHPGCGSDPYWGTIDSVSPHLLCRVINGFHVSKLGIEIATDENIYESFNTNDYNIYTDEESANQDLNKLM